jgi:hypothetical protein
MFSNTIIAELVGAGGAMLGVGCSSTALETGVWVC